MKKTLLFLIVLLCMGSVWAYDFSAVAPTGQTLYYNIISSADHTCGVVSNPSDQPTGVLVIPSSVQYNGATYAVTELLCVSDYGSFGGASGLTSVTIPNSVTSIGNRAFRGCRGLTSVIIPNSVTSIGNDAFFYCSGLTSVTIPNSVTSIGHYAFADCSGLTSVIIPNSVTSIGEFAFRGIKVITYCGSASYGAPWGAINVGCSIHEEGDFIYADNTKTTILAYIGTSTTATIPSSVTSIGQSAFAGCSGLTRVNYEGALADWCRIDFGNAESNPLSYAHDLYIGGQRISQVVVPSDIVRIKPATFAGASITRVTIPEGVKIVEEAAFMSCAQLETVELPSSLEAIRKNAFSGCTDTRPIRIPDSVFWIEENAFQNVTSIIYYGSAVGEPWGARSMNSYTEGDIIYSDSTKTLVIGSRPTVTTVVLPNTVTTIGARAFAGSSISSITLPESLISIRDYAFSGCVNLRHIDFPASLDTIGGYAFSGSGLDSVVVPPSVSVVKHWAFYLCENLRYAVMGDIHYHGNQRGKSTVAYRTFNECPNLEYLAVGYPWSFIDDDFCRDNESLRTFILGNGVDSVWLWAIYLDEGPFARSGAVSGYVSESVRFLAPESMYNIHLEELTFNAIDCGDEFGARSCTGYVGEGYCWIPYPRFYYDAASQKMAVEPRPNTNAYGTMLTQGYETATRYLKTLHIGEKVTRIPNYLCLDARELTSVHFPNRVREISNKAFQGTGLTSVRLPNSLTRIGKLAFAGTPLRNLTIPSSVTFIGDQAFNTNDDPEYVRVKSSTPPSVEGDPFSNYYEVTLYVPKGSSAAYLNDPTWSRFISNDSIRGRNFDIMEDNDDYVHIYAQAEGAGSVAGEGDYYAGDTVVLNAYPTSHSHFVGWQDGDTSLTKLIVMGSNINNLDNYFYTAYFVADTFNVTIGSSNPTMGTVSPSISGLYGAAQVGIVARPAEGYRFEGWSDGIEGESRYIDIMSDTVVMANFVPDVYDLMLASECDTMGVVTGSGTYAHGAVATATATPLEGYRFVKWSDGNETNPRSFTMDRDIEQRAIFEPEGQRLVLNYRVVDWTRFEVALTTADKAEYSSVIYIDSALTIPDRVLKFKVVGIDDGTFRNCNFLKSVSIGDGVASIGDNAFNGCSNLTRVDYRGSMAGWVGIYFGDQPLRYAHNLYINDTLVTRVVIPNSVTSIGPWAFEGCSNLESVSIGDGVASIGNSAFYGCSSLASVSIGDGVASIEPGAFYNCSGLTSVTIPNSVTSIGYSAFYGCSSLASVTFEGVVPPSIGGGNFENATSIVVPCGSLFDYKNNSGLSNRSLYISEIDGCEEHYNYLFFDTHDTEASVYGSWSNGRRGLAIPGNESEIVIPNEVTFDGQTYTVTAIGNYAFSNRNGLTSVTIPNSVTSIGPWAFEGCSNLTRVDYRGSMAGWVGIYFGDQPLRYAHNLYINDTLVTRVVIPDGTTRIANRPFEGLALSYMSVPHSVTSIDGDYRGRVNYNIDTLDYNGPEGRIGAFGSSAVKVLNIGDSITAITDNECYNWTSLTSVTIPNSVTSIGNEAFRDCSGLTSVTIPNSVTSIGDYTFNGCSSLASVTFEGVVPPSIGGGNFVNATSIVVPCGSLSDYKNNSGLSNRSRYISEIDGCDEHYYLFFDTHDTEASVYGNWSNGRRGLAIPGNESEIVIPNEVTFDGQTYTVTAIANTAFSNRNGLTSVTIPNSVTSIGANAFSGCSSIASVTISNSVTSIGTNAFNGCNSLESVSIGDGVTSIGDYTFNGCSSLESVSIGDGVTSIGPWAFEGCSNLTRVDYRGSMAGWVGIYFGDQPLRYAHNLYINDTLVTRVVIPDGTTRIANRPFEGLALSYMSVPHSVTSIEMWSVTNPTIDTLDYNGPEGSIGVFGSFAVKVLNIGDSITAITDNGCKNWTSLTSVSIGNGVTSIGNSAFYGCSSIANISIGDGVTSIGNSAFSGCSSIASVTIGNSVTSIGGSAFYGCSGLTSVTMRGTVPPTLGWSVFYHNASNRKIYVPCGAYDNYYNANNGWSNYRYDLSDPIVDIDVTVNAESGKGSASIIPLRGQNVRCDSTIVVTATPNYGYHFDHWSTGNTQAQDTIAIEGDTIITAYFANNQYAINVVSDNMDMGNVFGADTIDYLDSVSISAVANHGYRFSRWNDGSTDNPYTIQVVGDDTYTAIFVLDTFSLSVSSIDTIMGSATYSVGVIVGTGTSGIFKAPFHNGNKNSMNESLYLASEIGASGMIDKLWYYCTSANTNNYTTLNIYMGTTSATSLSSGWVGLNDLQLVYSATNGSISTNTGWEPYKLDTPFDYNGTDNLIIVVCRQASNLSQATYRCTTTNNLCRYRRSDDNSNYGLISNTTTAGGICSERANIKLSIGGSASGLAYTTPVTLVATANYGYHFDHWNDGDTTNPRVIVMDSNKTFVAHFDYNQYTITGTSANAVMGSVEGTATQNYLTNITLSATPNYGYHFTQWNDGSTVNPRVVQVDGNATYTAYFDYNQYTIDVVSEDSLMGTAAGGTTQTYLTTAVISAVANYGYHFVAWNDGNNDNPRTVVVDSNKVYTALFDYNQYTVAGTSADTVMGVVNGSATQNYLTTVILTAAANYGYHFVAWNDGNNDNPRTVTVDSNKVYTASFDYNEYTIGVASEDSLMGTAAGGTTQTYLTTAVISATANYGYHFVAWNDGNTDNPRNVVVDSNKMYTALFDYNQYTVAGASADTVMGVVNGSATQNYLTTMILTAAANYGYHFTQWNDGNTDNPRTVTVDSNKVYTASFDYNEYTIGVASEDSLMGTAAGGTTQTYLTTAVISATANYGYHFVAWNDGNNDNPRTVVVDSNKVYTALFDYNQYTVAGVSADTVMGVVNGSATQNYLTTVILTAAANYGYHFVQWNDGDTNAVKVVEVDSNVTYTASFDYNEYTIVVASEDSLMGTAAGGTTQIYLTTAMISATANYGYHFTQWNDGNNDNPRTVVVDSNKVYTALFDYNQYTVAGVSADTVMGVVNGSATQNYLTTVTLTAAANYGYHFTQWNDGNTDNPRTVTVDSNKVYTASFDYNEYTIGVASEDSLMGTAAGGTTQTYLTTAVISATANYGYHFTQWNDGNTDNPRTVVADSNKVYTALFDYNQYTVAGTSADTVMGVVNGSATQNYLTIVTLTAAANYGYHFVQWNDGDTNAVKVVEVDSNVTYTASFDYNQYTVAGASADTVMGVVNGSATQNYLTSVILTAAANYGYHFVQWNDGDTNAVKVVEVDSNVTYTATFDYNQYTIGVVSADSLMGTAAGAGEYQFNSIAVITATANEHYHFLGWSDGVSDNPRSVTVRSDSSFVALFAIDTHTVTLTVNDATMGMVEGEGEYAYGEEVTITAIANDGYRFVRWSNGDTAATITFVVTEDVDLEAFFEAEPVSIDEIETSSITVYSRHMNIYVKGGDGQMLTIFDIDGRIIISEKQESDKPHHMPAAGIYLVKVGSHPAKKVVVIR